MRLTDSARSSFHCFGDLGLHLRVGDVVRPPRIRHTPQDFSVNWISQDAAEAFNSRSGLLIDRTSLYDWWPRTSRGVGLACVVTLGQRPVRELWELDRL